jgi:hypothetical protein
VGCAAHVHPHPGRRVPRLGRDGRCDAGGADGLITSGTHLAKSGGRAAINTSPEPFTNWTASASEDGLVLGGLWLAIAHPLAFLVALVLFLGLVAWLLPKLFRFAARMLRRLRGRDPPALPIAQR